jgi:hypothetical protein
MSFNNGETSTRVAVTVDILNDGYEGRAVTWFGTFGASEKADDFAIRSLRDMGWTGTSLDDFTGLGSVDVDVVVSYREYQGKQRMDVTVWKPRGEGFVFDTPPDPGAMAALGARLKGKLVASARRGVGAAAPPFRPPPAGGDSAADEPLPF